MEKCGNFWGFFLESVDVAEIIDLDVLSKK